MTSPFRSLAGRASRRRARPAVERSTFVVVGLGGARFALPVELVERVARLTPGQRHVAMADQTLALTDVTAMLGITRARQAPAEGRVLVVRDGSRWWAVAVDAVFEVCAVETAVIAPWAAEAPGTRREARVATFERLGQTIVVLDLRRLLPESAS
jgi:chemotaxis signal transduction protein